jgi:cell division protein FtsB
VGDGGAVAHPLSVPGHERTQVMLPVCAYNLLGAMAFTVNDFRDLLEIIRTMPEWKEALRRELLGEEILSLPALIRDLLKVIEEMNKRLYRVEQDVEVLKADVEVLKADVGVLKADVGVLKADVEVLKADVGVLKADVEVLKADVEVLKTDVATLKGDSLERKYRERPFVYFRRILRKPKLLSDSELDDLLSQAQADGVLNDAEVEEISRLDAVVRGRRISDDRAAYLAVEVSVTIDARDVARAVQRAKLLEKIPGVVALPVVAGEKLTPEGISALKQSAAWVVLDGQARPGAELPT